jgi:hypothetical protein
MLTIYAREDPKSLSATNEDGFSGDEQRNTEYFMQRSWM